jgi:preprotein translocase subunit YajC
MPGGSLIFFMVLMFLLMWVLLIRPQQKERQAHQQMVSSLKKGDRVITIGGVFGTVGAVHEHELVLKVDDKTNTRLRVLKTAVHQRVSGDAAEESTETGESPERKKR